MVVYAAKKADGGLGRGGIRNLHRTAHGTLNLFLLLLDADSDNVICFAISGGGTPLTFCYDHTFRAKQFIH